MNSRDRFAYVFPPPNNRNEQARFTNSSCWILDIPRSARAETCSHLRRSTLSNEMVVARVRGVIRISWRFGARFTAKAHDATLPRPQNGIPCSACKHRTNAPHLSPPYDPHIRSAFLGIPAGRLGARVPHNPLKRYPVKTKSSFRPFLCAPRGTTAFRESGRVPREPPPGSVVRGPYPINPQD